MFYHRRNHSILFKSISIVLVCLFAVSDIAWAQPSSFSASNSNLAPELRFKTFSENHDLEFHNVVNAAYAAVELRNLFKERPIRESDIVRLNGKYFHSGDVKIDTNIRQEGLKLASGRRYAIITVKFAKDKKVDILLLEDYTNLTTQDLDELKRFKIKNDDDLRYFASPVFDGVWFVNPGEQVILVPGFEVHDFETGATLQALGSFRGSPVNMNADNAEASANASEAKDSSAVSSEENGLPDQRLGKWLQFKGAYFLPLDLASQVTDTMKRLISNAKSSIHIDMFLINDEKIWALLEEKARQGVDVKIIIGKNPETIRKETVEAIKRILDRNIPNLELMQYSPYGLRDGFRSTERFPDDHRKLVIVDGRYALVGDCNAKYWQERIATVIIYSPQGVSDLEKIFWQSWKLLKGKREISYPEETSNELYTILTERSLRDNIRLNILREILKAKKRIYIAQWCMEDRLVINALASKKASVPGIDIRVILNYSEGDFSYRPIKIRYPRNILTYEQLQREGIPVKWFSGKEAENYDHRKLVICDDIVITGSSDMYAKAYDGNRELSVRLAVPELTQHYADIFETDWASGFNKSYEWPKLFKSRIINFLKVAYKYLYAKWIILRYKGVNISPVSLPLSFQPIAKKIKTFLGFQYDDLLGNTFYRGFSGDEYRLMVDYGIFRITMGPDGYTTGKGVFTTDSYDIASKSAQIKRSRNRQPYIAVLRPKPGTKLLHLTMEERGKFEAWSLEHFGIKGGSFLISIYLLEKGYDGYYWREYDNGHTVVFLDPSSFDVLRFEKLKKPVLDAADKMRLSAEERNFSRLIEKYLKEHTLIEPRNGITKSADNKYGNGVSLNKKGRRIIDKLHILNGLTGDMNVSERKKLLYLLPDIIQLMRSGDKIINELGLSVIEKYFGIELKIAVLNLIKNPPLSEETFYDESSIRQNEKHILEEYVKNSLNVHHEQWMIPLLYLTTLDEGSKLYRAVRLLYKRAVNTPSSLKTRPKSLASVLGQKVGFTSGYNAMSTSIVDDMDIMQIRSNGNIWKDFAGYMHARKNILKAISLYPLEIERAFNHALRVATMAKLAIDIFMQNEDARILSWEEVGDFIVAASSHDLGKGAKESIVKVAKNDLIKGFDIAVKNIFAKVYLSGGNLKIVLPDGKEWTFFCEGINASTWVTKEIRLNGNLIKIDIMLDDSGNYIFRTPISMIDLINAPRQLTPDEQRLVTSIHPVESVRMLEEAGLAIPVPVKLAILYHHNLKGIDEIKDDVLRSRVNKIANLLSLFDLLDASQDYSRPYRIGLLSEDVTDLCKSLDGIIDKTCAEWFAKLITQGSVYQPDILGIFAKTRPFMMLYHASSLQQMLRPLAMNSFKDILLRLRLREGEFEAVFNEATEIIANILIDPAKSAEDTKKAAKDPKFLNVSKRLLSTDHSLGVIATAINSVIDQSEFVLTPDSLAGYLLLLEPDLSLDIFSRIKDSAMQVKILKQLAKVETERSLYMQSYLRNFLVQVRAYELWEEEGKPHGRHTENWLKAEEEIFRRIELSGITRPMTGSPEDADCMIIEISNNLQEGNITEEQAAERIIKRVLTHWVDSEENMLNIKTARDILKLGAKTRFVKDIIALLEKHMDASDQTILRERLGELLIDENKKIINNWITVHTRSADDFVEIKSPNVEHFVDFMIKSSVLSSLGYDLKLKLSAKIMELLENRKIVLIKVKKDEIWPAVYMHGQRGELTSFSVPEAIYIFLDEDAGMRENGFDHFSQWFNTGIIVNEDGTISDRSLANMDAGLVTSLNINPELFFQLGHMHSLPDLSANNGYPPDQLRISYLAAKDAEFDNVAYELDDNSERDSNLDMFIKTIFSINTAPAGSETNPLVRKAEEAPQKPKGSCADCLNSIIGNDELFNKALTDGFDIEKDLKPARLKLKDPDQPFSDTTIYDREIAPLKYFGILVPAEDGKLKFSLLMMRPNTTGPPDKEYTRNLIRKITEIEYPIGNQGEAKDKPFHRGEIPPDVRPAIKELIKAKAQEFKDTLRREFTQVTSTALERAKASFINKLVKALSTIPEEKFTRKQLDLALNSRSGEIFKALSVYQREGDRARGCKIRKGEHKPEFSQWIMCDKASEAFCEAFTKVFKTHKVVWVRSKRGSHDWVMIDDNIAVDLTYGQWDYDYICKVLVTTKDKIEKFRYLGEYDIIREYIAGSSMLATPNAADIGKPIVGHTKGLTRYVGKLNDALSAREYVKAFDIIMEALESLPKETDIDESNVNFRPFMNNLRDFFTAIYPNRTGTGRSDFDSLLDSVDIEELKSKLKNALNQLKEKQQDIKAWIVAKTGPISELKALLTLPEGRELAPREIILKYRNYIRSLASAVQGIGDSPIYFKDDSGYINREAFGYVITHDLCKDLSVLRYWLEDEISAKSFEQMQSSFRAVNKEFLRLQHVANENIPKYALACKHAATQDDPIILGDGVDRMAYLLRNSFIEDPKGAENLEKFRMIVSLMELAIKELAGAIAELDPTKKNLPADSAAASRLGSGATSAIHESDERPSQAGDTLLQDAVAGISENSALSEAARIHEENLKTENMPTIPKDTMLCHITADSILPAEEQKKILQVEIDQFMRKPENGYKSEVIVRLDDADCNTPDEFIAKLQDLIRAKESFYKAQGYANVTFDIACPNIELVARVQKDVNVPALAFEREGEGDMIQLESILYALRALQRAVRDDNINSILEAYKFLAGKDYPTNAKNVAELAVEIVFKLPVSKIEDPKERDEANRIMAKNIQSAA